MTEYRASQHHCCIQQVTFIIMSFKKSMKTNHQKKYFLVVGYWLTQTKNMKKEETKTYLASCLQLPAKLYSLAP